MARALDIELQGVDSLERKLMAMAFRDRKTAVRLEGVFLRGPGKDLKKQIRSNTPLGPTGNLKRSIVAKRYRRRRKQYGVFYPEIYVRSNPRIAPHAMNVEYGHAGPYPESRRTPGHPFFRPVVDEQRPAVIRAIKKKSWAFLKKLAET